MKKLGKISLIALIASMLISLMPIPVKAVSSANTLAGLRKDLAAFEQQKKNNDNKKKWTQSEIVQKNNDIANAKKEIPVSILIRKAAVLINIPVVFFSLKLVLFRIGVPITKSLKFETLLK